MVICAYHFSIPQLYPIVWLSFSRLGLWGGGLQGQIMSMEALHFSYVNDRGPAVFSWRWIGFDDSRFSFCHSSALYLSI